MTQSKKDSASCITDKLDQYFESNRVRKAFVVGNDYGDENNSVFTRDAVQFAKVLHQRCVFKDKNSIGGNNTDLEISVLNDDVRKYDGALENSPLNNDLVVLLNTSKLMKVFKKYLNTLSVIKSSIEFLFYFSGHANVDTNGRLHIQLNDGSLLELNELVEAVDKKDLDDSKVLSISVKLSTTFRKLFILDCCRSTGEEVESTQETNSTIIQVLKGPSHQLEEYKSKDNKKEYKNTAFLYSSNLGYPSFAFKKSKDKSNLSALTTSLINRINSSRAPGRNLIDVVSVIQNDLMEVYRDNHKRIRKSEKKEKAKSKSQSKSATIKVSNGNNDGLVEDSLNDQYLNGATNSSDSEVLNSGEDSSDNEDSSNGKELYSQDCIQELVLDLNKHMGNSISNSNIPTSALIKQIIKNKFNILYGDITVGRFVFVPDDGYINKDKVIDELRKEIESLKSIINNNSINNNNNSNSNSNSNSNIN